MKVLMKIRSLKKSVRNEEKKLRDCGQKILLAPLFLMSCHVFEILRRVIE